MLTGAMGFILSLAGSRSHSSLQVESLKCKSFCKGQKPQCEQHYWVERMEPNFPVCTMEGQEVMGTNCSKRNPHCAPRKPQFFTTSMVSPGTRVQKSPSWVYSTRHSHEPPELPLESALLWAKDFRGPFQPCFLSNPFQYFVLPQHPQKA